SYRVVGMLTAGNQLVVPGGRFASRDVAGIRNWLENLADRGEKGVTERRSAFGLLGEDLVEIQDEMQQAVSFSTAGMQLSDVLKKLERSLEHPLVISESVRLDIAGVKIEDNLEGVATGTALAALLRPAGLVMAPARPRG